MIPAGRAKLSNGRIFDINKTSNEQTFFFKERDGDGTWYSIDLAEVLIKILEIE